MVTYYMARTFDHAGYYETRLVLAALAFAAALFFGRRRGDWRFMIMFASGVLFQGILEWNLELFELRGSAFTYSAFGVTFQPPVSWIFQGLAEGGLLCMMSYWFLDLFRPHDDRRQRRFLYLFMCALIVVFASTVGILSRGADITSPRPMFAVPVSSMLLSFFIIGSLGITWLKGGKAFHYLGAWYAGCFIYVLLTFTTLHLWGARYIAVRNDAGDLDAASVFAQFWVMSYSHLIEVAGGKIHYFVIPYALGLIKWPEEGISASQKGGDGE